MQADPSFSIEDKKNWGPGPWEDEPDRYEFEAYGLPCLILRHKTLGHFCGYVAVPPDHPDHSRDYNDVKVNVHGGLTYANVCHDDICHKPKPGQPDNVYWFGFDCAHCDDLSPGMEAHLRMIGSAYPELYKETVMTRLFQKTYKDINYLIEETTDLARQLAKHNWWFNFRMWVRELSHELGTFDPFDPFLGPYKDRWDYEL